MNLKHLTDTALHHDLKKLVRHEREVLTDILHHLREVERRRLFSFFKYSSLYAYAMGDLGYSKDQAHRRIAAMRLLKTFPKIEEKIETGAVNLTTLNLVQTLFKSEKSFKLEKKLDVLKQIENKSTREVEKIVLSHSSKPILLSEKIRAIGEGQVEVTFTGPEEIQEKIEKLKGLFAHSDPNMTLSELFQKLCDLGIKKWDPALQMPKPGKSLAAPKVEGDGSDKISKAETKRLVWRKAQSKCEQCGSVYALEIDHMRPKALHGSDAIENLRLLCRSCNQREAINWFGEKKMEHYLE